MIKLYNEDSYIKEFTGIVVSCTKLDAGYKVILDRTAFFPTAGGQDCDTGTIDSIPVMDVFEEDGKICHILKSSIDEGKCVTGKLDWNVRFRKMQHHTAEHIVSGIAHSFFGLENTGFHLSDKEVTIDYSGILTPEDLVLLEQKANEAVWQNLTVTAVYPDQDSLSAISYRSKLELTENVRIVTIDGIDTCACCAPHVSTTGQIGLIKLKDMMHHRCGVRLCMICGKDALLDYEEKHESVLKISNLLSAKQAEVSQNVERILSELSAKKQTIAVMSKQLAMSKAELICETEGNLCVFEKDFDNDALRTLVNYGKRKCSKIFAAFSGDDASGYNFIMASDNINMKTAAKDITSALSGRGGGSEDMIQGFIRSSRAEIEDFFENYKEI